MFFASRKTDGVWCRQSPNEISPLAEHRGQPPRHAPLQEPPAFRRLRLHGVHAAGGRRSSLLRLEQTDVWERHTTWTTRATRRLQGDEPDEDTAGVIACCFSLFSRAKQQFWFEISRAHSWLWFYVNGDRMCVLSLSSREICMNEGNPCGTLRSQRVEIKNVEEFKGSPQSNRSSRTLLSSHSDLRQTLHISLYV